MGIVSSALDTVRMSFMAAFGKQEARILLLGLDGAGKTASLYKLKIGESVATIPTIGFNVERIDWGNISFVAWDVGGQDKIRRLWSYYFEGSQALIFVVDSSDSERLETAKEELHMIMSADEMLDAHVLVMANKQDLPGALSPTKMAESLELHKLRPGRTGARKWWVQGTCAVTGEGLAEGLEWVATAIRGH